MGTLNRKLIYTRVLLLACGVIGALWSVAVIPSSLRTMPANDIAARTIADDRFKPGVLVGLLARIDIEPSGSPIRAELVRAKALVQLRLAEEARSRKSSEEADQSAMIALDGLRSAISAEPCNSFLWLMLYSFESARSGFDPLYIHYLEQSYLTGPHEGWVSKRRIRLALAAFPMLTDTLRSAAASEFEELVDSDFIDDAAENLMGAGWPYREQLLSRLSLADLAARQNLHKRLAADGVKLDIPGISLDERPWR